MPLPYRTGALWLGVGLALGLALPGAAQPVAPHAGHPMPAGDKKQNGKRTKKAADPHAGHTVPGDQAGDQAGDRAGARRLPALPEQLPDWMENKKKNHIFYKRGKYNFDTYNIDPLARDLNAVAVGHAMAYEDLVTGKADQLETKTFERINRVLKNPPKFMPDEALISPTFGRKYGMLEMMFDWTHILHAQTVDVLASTDMNEEEKDREIERLWRYYFDSVPWKITPLPMNMGYLDSQPYSKAFRQTYPKVNGLFWGYHWLQGAMYDLLYGKSLEQQRAAYEEMGRQYHTVELYRTDRPFMPMFAELSPRFAQKFPHIANAFDNLHMLHDMVNDILATEWMTERQKEEQIKRAMWLVSADAHEGEKPGDMRELNGLHDHRFMPGMPGMGMMPGGHGGHGMPGMEREGMPEMEREGMPGTHTPGMKMPGPGKSPAVDPHAGHQTPARNRLRPRKSKPAPMPEQHPHQDR